MKRIVLDTNCLLMCLPKRSPYRIIWDTFLTGKFMLCVTNEILEEYLEILSQKSNYVVADNIVSAITNSRHVLFVTTYFNMHLITSDEDDNKFADCAFAAGASCIVSNDSHFKELKRTAFPKIPVLRIEEFALLLTRSAGDC